MTNGNIIHTTITVTITTMVQCVPSKHKTSTTHDKIKHVKSSQRFDFD